MTTVSILYHSGYGHTQKQAEAVHSGAASVSGVTAELVRIDAEGNITDEQWETLAKSDAIIFGSPTYMGNVSWQFKKLADASSKPWFSRLWQDKIAAGFTNSASPNGDKAITLSYLVTLAMQHGMVWVGTGLPPSSTKAAKRTDLNWLGGFTGALAQSPADATPEEGPLPGDLDTAKSLGVRVAGFALQRKAA